VRCTNHVPKLLGHPARVLRSACVHRREATSTAWRGRLKGTTRRRQDHHEIDSLVWLPRDQVNDGVVSGHLNRCRAMWPSSLMIIVRRRHKSDGQTTTTTDSLGTCMTSSLQDQASPARRRKEKPSQSNTRRDPLRSANERGPPSHPGRTDGFLVPSFLVPR
jgi:hypothetical protein